VSERLPYISKAFVKTQTLTLHSTSTLTEQSQLSQQKAQFASKSTEIRTVNI